MALASAIQECPSVLKIEAIIQLNITNQGHLSSLPVFPTIVWRTFLFDGNSSGFHGQNYNSAPFQALAMPLCDKAGIISNVSFVSASNIWEGVISSCWKKTFDPRELFQMLRQFNLPSWLVKCPPKIEKSGDDDVDRQDLL